MKIVAEVKGVLETPESPFTPVVLTTDYDKATQTLIVHTDDRTYRIAMSEVAPKIGVNVVGMLRHLLTTKPEGGTGHG